MAAAEVYKLAVFNTHPIQYFAPLYRRLARHPKIELTVYFFTRKGMEEYLDLQFGEQVRWDVPLVEGYPHEFLFNLRKPDVEHGFFRSLNPTIVTKLARNRYDLVWIHGTNLASSMLAAFTARLFGMPVANRGETHLLLPRTGFRNLSLRFLIGPFYRHVCNLHLAIGTRNREFLTTQGVPEEAIFLAPYSVDNEYFRSRALADASDGAGLRAEIGLPPDVPILLYASKFMRRKHPDDLLEAYRRIRANGERAALVFIGAGEMADELAARVQTESIPDVHFLGFRNQSELPGLYASCDIFVLPSENEPWGLIINEVMCAGLPVVTSEEVGAVPDLIHHGRNGFTFETGNVEQLERYLSILIRDGELRERMGAESLRLIESWGVDATANGVLEALEWLDQRRKPERG